MTADRRDTRLAAGVVGCLTLLAIGWTGLLTPSLIRSVERAFSVDDAAIGLVYLAYVLAYTIGAFAGGPLTERRGRRVVLTGAAIVHGVGIGALGLAPAYAAFVLAAIPAGLGAGALDGGANGLVLDLYRDRRGRAMNLLHFFFSVGALSAPFVVGRLVEADVGWSTVYLASASAGLALALAYATVSMPSGRHVHEDATSGTSSDGAAAVRRDAPRRLAGPLVLLGLAIGMYVASELGVSNWLVRFLEPAPLATATLALSLYWAGIAIGRAVASSIADRFDHATFTIACAVGLGLAVITAIVVPSLELSIGCFLLAGVASGPIFPMIVAIGGDRYPDRSAAVGAVLTGAGDIGSIVYPPLMGLLSVTIGLPLAMTGASLLAFGSAAVLVAFTRTGSGV